MKTRTPKSTTSVAAKRDEVGSKELLAASEAVEASIANLKKKIENRRAWGVWYNTLALEDNAKTITINIRAAIAANAGTERPKPAARNDGIGGKP